MRITTKNLPLLIVLYLIILIVFTFFSLKLFQLTFGSEVAFKSFVYVGYFIIYFGTVLISCVLSINAYRNKLSRVAAHERIETYLTGALKEKLIERELFEAEKALLELKFKKTGNRDFDLDRRSGVFRIQGQLVKLPPNPKVLEEWSVRGLTITEINYPDIRFKDFHDGDQIVVEFSPYSKWVWELYKVVGDKRVWMMNLSEQ